MKRIFVRASEANKGIIGQGRRLIKTCALLNNDCLVCNLKVAPIHPAAFFILETVETTRQAFYEQRALHLNFLLLLKKLWHLDLRKWHSV